MKQNSSDRILMLLKLKGEATSLLISEELAMSKEGARKHLLSLLKENLVKSSIKSEGVGRPSTYYSLTEKGLSRFPNSHADISVQLLQSVKKLLGNNALNLLISDRETAIYDRYAKKINGLNNIEQKLETLSKKRSKEGYLAEWKKENESYYLIENHCPIRAAASECRGFCRSELHNFKQLIGPEYNTVRTEYIIEGEHRCVYKIDKVKH